MKVAVVGATGWIGSHILNEAKQRGHEVVALVREVNRVEDPDIEARAFDLTAPIGEMVDSLSGVDAVIASIGGRAKGNHDIVKQAAKKLLMSVSEAKIGRLLWVGGAGSLEVAPGVTLISTPEFPEEYKAEAIAQGEALDVFKQTANGVNWTFVSPAAEIFPGETLSKYRTGGEQLLLDEQGNSRISVSDYAKAMIDELESNQHPNQRIGVAY